MKKKILLGFFLVFSAIAPVVTAETNPDSETPVAEENLANNNPVNYPVLNEEDWRSLDFGDIPWSVPVIMKDDFDGDQLAVMDRNKTGNMFFFGKESGIVSMWAENKIRIYYYLREDSGDIISGDKWTVKEADTLSIKVGEEVFRLDGKNGNFQVEDDLARALANAPEGKSKIKITFEDSGDEIVNDIGEETVKAWKVVYSSSEIATE